ncbi:hypothetical protein [uncultured Stenotrophomonas sp.]|uniref:hypothetical protein n=1 Tax=uncultured Stenotrophomonas sp. TaxID=165438 RepID=UPI0025E9C449|nr:hypothetical protein [uncultured Stenotrophomonas sp.]
MSSTFMTWLGFAAMMLIAVTFTWRPAYATLRPPRHRPVAFLFGSLFFMLMAFAFAWMAATALSTGHVHLSHHRAGTIDAWREIQPITYWLLIVLAYLIGLLTASYAIAGIALMDG